MKSFRVAAIVAPGEVRKRMNINPIRRERIQVERVTFLRYGEARGDYDKVVATPTALDPHGN